MKRSSFLLAASLIESWLKGKKNLFTLSHKFVRKSKDLMKEHQCCWVKIPYIPPLMRKMPVSYSSCLKSKKNTSHTFIAKETKSKSSGTLPHSKSSCINRELPSSRIGNDLMDQDPSFLKKVIERPLKEHLLATKRLEQSHCPTTPSPKKHHTISLLSSETFSEEGSRDSSTLS